MRAAPRLEIDAPRRARAEYLARAYADMVEDTERLGGVIDQLRPLHAASVIEDWHKLAGAEAHVALAHDLMARHYDPRYLRHRERIGAAQETVTTSGLGPEDLDGLADRIAARVATL